MLILKIKSLNNKTISCYGGIEVNNKKNNSNSDSNSSKRFKKYYLS